LESTTRADDASPPVAPVAPADKSNGEADDEVTAAPPSQRAQID
jgi:hypothetical protein